MAKDDTIENYLPALKAARILGVSPVTLRKMAMDGKIDAYLTPGRKYRYRVSSFLSRAKQATEAYHKRQKAKQLDLFQKKDGTDGQNQQGKGSGASDGSSPQDVAL